MSDDVEPAPLDMPGLPGAAGGPTAQPPRATPLVDDAHRQSSDAVESQRRVPFLLMAVVCCLSAGVVIAIALVLVNRSDGGVPAAGTAARLETPETTTTSTTTVPTTTTEPTTTTVSTTTTTLPAARAATLYANFARVRALPTLDGAIQLTLRDREGADLRVIGPHDNGWYLIEVDGVRGWIFGAFVLPPDPGLAVGVTRDAQPAELLAVDGRSLLRANSSGSKVIIVDIVGDLYEVLLPEGDTGYVAQSSILVVASS